MEVTVYTSEIYRNDPKFNPDLNPANEPNGSNSSDPTNRKRTNDNCDKQVLDSNLPFQNSKRFRTSLSDLVIVNKSESALCNSDDDESIYSEQGYETVEICNLSFSDNQSNSDNEDDQSGNDEDVFNDEFEIASDCEENGGRDNESSGSEDDTDFEDMVIASSVAAIIDTDSDCLADSESDSDLSGFELSNFDPEIGPGSNETWNCLECENPNPPRVRYCDHCWQERKNWLPHRPKPRKRKNKKTDNQPIKSSLKNKVNSGPSPREGEAASSSSSSSSSKASEDSDESSSSKSQPNLLRSLSQESQDSGFNSQNLLEESDEVEGVVESIVSTAVKMEESVGTNTVKEPQELRTSALKKSISAPIKKSELLCNFCLVREKNAGIIHGGIIHQVCCYPCAKKCMKRRAPCPICRRRIEKIAKIIVA